MAKDPPDPVSKPIEDDNRASNGKFKPGNNANPNGRPAGARSRSSEALDAIAAGAAPRIVQAMITAAENGDTRAGQLILSRVWRPSQGRRVVISLPQLRTPQDALAALDTITQAAASAVISLEDARDLASLIEAFRTTLATVDLDERIKALEELQQGVSNGKS